MTSNLGRKGKVSSITKTSETGVTSEKTRERKRPNRRGDDLWSSKRMCAFLSKFYGKCMG